MLAKVITLEGCDNIGKSTQTAKLVDYLKEQGKRVQVVKSPYNDGFTYFIIYHMLRNGWARRVPNIFQIIHFINKLYFQLFMLSSLRKKADYIIMDRWVLSMYSYGLADGVSKWFTKQMMSFIFVPDLTILLDRKPKFKKNADAYEADANYQNNVRKLYLSWAFSHRSEVEVIDASKTKEQVFEQIVLRLNSHFRKLVN